MKSYKVLDKKGFKHKTFIHGQKEYVAKDGTTINYLEGFWSRLKLSIKSAHIHVSKNYLAKYASEFGSIQQTVSFKFLKPNLA